MQLFDPDADEPFRIQPGQALRSRQFDARGSSSRSSDDIASAPAHRVSPYGCSMGRASDDWSMALANHLVGNAPDAAALEITLGSFSARFSKAAWIALAGAEARADISGEAVSFHRTLHAQAKSVLTIDAAPAGMRISLAVAGGLKARIFLGLHPLIYRLRLAGMRAVPLAADDRLTIRTQPDRMDISETPQGLPALHI